MFVKKQFMSVNAVFREVTKRPDTLCEWAKSHRSYFTADDHPKYEQSMAFLLNTIKGQKLYTENAINEFFGNTPKTNYLPPGDSALIATAYACNATVVTYENGEPTNAKGQARVKIPRACAPLGVRCITPLELFTELGIVFDSYSLVKTY